MAETDPPLASASDESWLVGRRAVVTGGGRGIGKAIALELARLGAALSLVSRSESAAQVAAEISSKGGIASAHIGSVADEAFARSVLESAERTGGIDILVNAAAALGPIGRFAECSMKEFAEVLATNLLGTCNFMRWALPQMERRGFGRIINFAGGGAAYAYPNFTGYGVSKVGVVRLTETVAAEIAPSLNVTVNVIAPGAIATDLLKQVRQHGGEVRTITSIEEPVRLVLFLASPGARHINGRFIHVRDSYEDPDLFLNQDMLTLRRVERR
jgi:NAD(P)-dependent dehydrogenase (short-subunit alcohol dehydrogenase family)